MIADRHRDENDPRAGELPAPAGETILGGHDQPVPATGAKRQDRPIALQGAMVKFNTACSDLLTATVFVAWLPPKVKTVTSQLPEGRSHA